MPKIQAATVREHREHVQGALVDAAERLLRDGGPDSLTAGAVAAEAGIARNSIYRYVDSVDDLRGLVLARHLPQWGHAVAAALDGVSDPTEVIVTWSRANLEQAARSGHGWLMRIARGLELPRDTRDAVDRIHDSAVSLAAAWQRVAPGRADLGVELVRGLVDAGFRRLDAGDDAALLIETVTASVRAMVAALGRPGPVGQPS